MYQRVSRLFIMQSTVGPETASKMFAMCVVGLRRCVLVRALCLDYNVALFHCVHSILSPCSGAIIWQCVRCWP